MTLPAGATPVEIFSTSQGAPTVIRLTYRGQKYILKMNPTVLGVFVAPGPGPNDMPNFAVQSGNLMAIEKDTSS